MQTDREPRSWPRLHHRSRAGQPTVGYKATDDFGLAEMRIHREVQRSKGPRMPREVGVPVRRASRATSPLQCPWKGNRCVDLRPLKLAKVTKVTIQLEAIDFRGSAPGKSASALVFQVTIKRYSRALSRSGSKSRTTDGDHPAAARRSGSMIPTFKRGKVSVCQIASVCRRVLCRRLSRLRTGGVRSRDRCSQRGSQR